MTASEFVKWFDGLADSDKILIGDLQICVQDPNEACFYGSNSLPRIALCDKNGWWTDDEEKGEAILVI